MIPSPPAIDLSEPFVLLDDARPTGAAHLYRDYRGCVVANDPADVPLALEQLRRARDHGLHAAGFIGYGARAAFEPRLGFDPSASELPCLWFGLFVQRVAISSETLGTMMTSSPTCQFTGVATL